MRQQHDNASSVTQAEIARHCGVKQTTVSRVLSNHPYVREEIRQRVLAAVRELGYAPAAHDTARRLVLRRQGKTLLNRTLAIVIQDDQVQYRFFNQILLGFRHIAEQSGYTVAVINAFGDDPSAGEIPLLIQRGEIDGIAQLSFVTGGVVIQQRWATATSHPIAMCLIMQHPGTTGVSSVIADYRQGGYLVMRHLLELGHRHLCYYAHLPYEAGISGLRFAGVRQAFSEYGLNAEQQLCIQTPMMGWGEPSALAAFADLGGSNGERYIHIAQQRRAFLDFLEQHPKVTAIVTNNDTQAILITYALREAGIRVPEDISVTGFDDTDALIDSLGRNLLTTVRLPLFEVGCAAARWLIANIEGETPPPIPGPLPVELIIRKTTGPCPHPA